MIHPRIIPILLLNDNGGLVKTQNFKNPVYIGDPINAVRIFN
jgi:cyclase